MKTVTFSAWLVQAFELANKKPLIWLGAVLVWALLLAVSRVSQALAIVFSVQALFMGVGIVDHIHRQTESLTSAIKKQLPLSLRLAIILTLVWFVFRAFANINAGEPEKIIEFFFHWEISADYYQDKVFRQLIVWFYSTAIVALIFTILMLNSFGSWFSYPLMLFKDYNWNEARDVGRQAFAEHAGAMYKLTGFLLLTAFIGMGLAPLLTPLFYMLVSTLMYISYNDIFVNK